MQKLQIEDGRTSLFISQDIFQEYKTQYSNCGDVRGSFVDYLSSIVRLGLWRVLHEDLSSYIRLYLEKRKSGMAILDAHGRRNSRGNWLYQDGTREHLVQSWINAHEGEYGCLVLFVCDADPAQHRLNLPTSRGSLLVIPDGPININEMYLDAHKWNVFCPDGHVGEVDAYTAQYEICELQKLVLTGSE